MLRRTASLAIILVLAACSGSVTGPESTEPSSPDGEPTTSQQALDSVRLSPDTVDIGRGDTVRITPVYLDENGQEMPRPDGVTVEYLNYDDSVLTPVGEQAEDGSQRWRGELPGRSGLSVRVTPDGGEDVWGQGVVEVASSTQVSARLLSADDSVRMEVEVSVPDDGLPVDRVRLQLQGSGRPTIAGQTILEGGPIAPGETRTVEATGYVAPDGPQAYRAVAVCWDACPSVKAFGDWVQVDVRQSDVTSPTLTFEHPAEGAVYTTGDATISLAFRMQDDRALHGYSLSISWTDACGWGSSGFSAMGWSASRSVQRDVHCTKLVIDQAAGERYEEVQPLQEGENHLIVRAVDAALNATTDTLTVMYDPDA